MLTFARTLLMACLTLAATATSASAQSVRLTVFISDNHFGIGKQGGQWHPYEDARWASEFAPFLEAVSRQGNGATDLVLNGDTFELWQSLQNDCVYPDDDLGCTETEALARMRVVLAAHAEELEAIRKFATTGSNTVSIVPGNHDAALAFPRVAAETLKAIGAPPDRVRVLAEGYWVSPDGLVYAEHGHQIGKDPNQLDDWPKPFVSQRGNVHLRRSWGEEFVQDFYNQFEAKYPIIDNLADEASGIRYGLAAEGKLASAKDVGKFAIFFLTQTSFGQFFQGLGGDGEEGAEPQWDFEAIKKTGDRFLVESIPPDEPLRRVLEKAASEGTLGVSVSRLSPEELESICAARASLIAQDEEVKRKPTRVSPCPQTSLGALTARLRSRDKSFRTHLTALSRTLTGAGGFRRPFALYVFSHTHLAEVSYAPFEHTSSDWKPLAMNTGAWQRTISEKQIEQYMSRMRLKPADVLKLQPQDLPPCYPAVFVPPYQTTPVGWLNYWRRGAAGWALANHCE